MAKWRYRKNTVGGEWRALQWELERKDHWWSGWWHVTRLETEEQCRSYIEDVETPWTNYPSSVTMSNEDVMYGEQRHGN